MLAATGSRRRRSRLTLAASLVGLALLLVGCSNPGSVTKYNADTEENFLLACREANTSGLDDDELDEVCGCWYRAISGQTEGVEGLSFDEFEEVEDNIRTALEQGQLNNDEDLERIAGNFVDVLNDSNCLTTGPRAG